MAAARVWDVVGEFVDRDVSAYNPHIPRPAYEAMITELEAGEVDVIVAWKVDRLLRRPRDFEALWDRLEAHGASLATVADGIDSTVPIVGELVPRLLTTFAKLESQNLSVRAKRKHEEIAAAGRRSGGGRRPFGLTADWTAVVEHEAQEIRDAAEAIIVGSASRYSVAVDWNARGIRTSCGNLWTQTLVSSMFRSPRLVGARRYRGDLVRTGAFPAILELEVWQALQAAIGWRTRTAPGRFLLSGLLPCSLCGAVMIGQRRPKDKARFFGHDPHRDPGFAAGGAGGSRQAHDVGVGRKLLAEQLDELPDVKAIVADRGYRGLKILAQNRNLTLDIKAPPKGAKRFVPMPPLPKVEHAFAHLGRWRRLARCYEEKESSAKAWLEVAALGYLFTRLRAIPP